MIDKQIGPDTHGQLGTFLENSLSFPTRRAILRAAAGLALAPLAASPVIAALKSKDTGHDELDFASALEAAKAVRQRKISSYELTQRMLTRIEKFNPKLNAVVNILHDQANSEARRADESQARGDLLGPLHGVPILVKDAFEIAGVPTTAGIDALVKYRPATDSEVVRRLRAAGAIILGNTNVPFGLNDWQSYNKIYGTTNNPWDMSRTPGGSSGGSTAALSAGLAYLSPGSDRTGSLRVPAHFCGVYGHKPSLNVVPLRGWMPSPSGSPQLPETLAVAGPLARSARDLMLAMQIMGGPDGNEALAYRWAMPAPRRKRLQDYRVGFVLDDPACPVDEPVRRCLAEAVGALGKAGVQLKEGWPAGIDPKAQYRTYLYLLYSIIGMLPPGVKLEDMKPLALKADGSIASVFAQTLFDPHSRYLDYVREQASARSAWKLAFRDIDVFLMPASFVLAFPHDHSEPQISRHLMTMAGPRPYLDLIFWNSFANLSGNPATTAPIGRSPQELPVGVQILGPYLEDATPIDFADKMATVVGGFVSPPGFE
jgi:amidase